MSEDDRRIHCWTACRCWATFPTSTAPACWSGWTSTCRSGPARASPPWSPTTSASGPPCPPWSTCWPRGPRSPPAPIWAGPTVRPDARWDLGPVREELARLAPQVELLENLRFDPGEEHERPGLRRQADQRPRRLRQRRLRGLPPHATPRWSGHPAGCPVPPGSCSSGRSRPWAACSARPARPFVAVVGGAKVADKLGVLKALLDRVDVLVVGGGMAFTFLAAAGHDVGGSMVDHDRIDDCAALLASGKRILLPTDIVALEPGADFGCDCSGGEVRIVGDGHPRRLAGPRHRAGHGRSPTPRPSGRPAPCCGTARWGSSRTPGSAPGPPVWPGPWPSATATPSSAGETAPPPSTSWAWTTRSSFISTGGGASLELLEYGDLPGLAALRGAPNAPPAQAAPDRGPARPVSEPPLGAAR